MHSLQKGKYKDTYNFFVLCCDIVPHAGPPKSLLQAAIGQLPRIGAASLNAHRCIICQPSSADWSARRLETVATYVEC